MLTLDEIIDFCDNHDYDIRKSGNARWIDQKCTPDVIWSIADFILDYVDNVNKEFTVKDIWQSEYAKQTIAETYSKPGTDNKKAENEYDKVFSQPLAMFCYAGVIEDISTTSRHKYVVKNRDVMEYIARNDMYSLRFLYCYIEKVLKDSNLYSYFESFFEKQNKATFDKMKEEFVDFYHTYTPVKKDYEPKRIFTKVLNPLAFKMKKKGTERGHLSKNIIIKSEMMYNRDNFRDIYKDKPKEVSRKEWLAQNPDIDRRDGYFEQMMASAKKVLKKHNKEKRNGLSELTQFNNEHTDNTLVMQMHHIFPKNEYPEIMHYIENLIALTPNQHYGYAHPDNHTQKIDKEAQQVILTAKTCSIQQNIMQETDVIYEFSNLLTVLSVGFEDIKVLEITENDYIDVLHTINAFYENI